MYFAIVSAKSTENNKVILFHQHLLNICIFPDSDGKTQFRDRKTETNSFVEQNLPKNMLNDIV